MRSNGLYPTLAKESTNGTDSVNRKGLSAGLILPWLGVCDSPPSASCPTYIFQNQEIPHFNQTVGLVGVRSETFSTGTNPGIAELLVQYALYLRIIVDPSRVKVLTRRGDRRLFKLAHALGDGSGRSTNLDTSR
jgi:hypothetical protein